MESTSFERTRQQSSNRSAVRCDDGFTLIEMLMVIAILGVLATVVVMSVSGITAESADASCRTDGRQLQVAAEAFVAQTGLRQITATGTDHDRFERTLAERGFLHAPSPYHDLDDQGVVIPEENSPC